MSNPDTILQSWQQIHRDIQADITSQKLTKSEYEAMIKKLHIASDTHAQVRDALSGLSDMTSDVGHITDAIGTFTGHSVGAGPLSAIFAALISAGPILYDMIKNRRLPKSRADAVKLGIALVSIVLTEIVLASVGGLLVAGIFGLILATLGVIKILNKIAEIRATLISVHEKMQGLDKKINDALSRRDKLTEAEKKDLVQDMKTYVALGYKNHVLSIHLPIHKVGMPLALACSLLFLAGAILFFTPMGPLGASLMLISGIAGTTVMLFSWVVAKIRQYRAGKTGINAVKKADQSTYENTVGYDLSALETSVQGALGEKLRSVPTMHGEITLETIQEKMDDFKRLEHEVERRAEALAVLGPKCDALRSAVSATQDEGLISRFVALDHQLNLKQQEIGAARQEIGVAYSNLEEMRILHEERRDEKNAQKTDRHAAPNKADEDDGDEFRR